MTAAEFNLLSHDEKIESLETGDGVYLEVYYLSGPCKVALFELNGFYCSVWLNKGTDRIVKVRAFDDYNKLDNFINGIDITELFSLL